jgi:hypothetical protein
LKGEYIAHGDLLKIRTPFHKLIIRHANTRSISTCREVCAVVINYRERETAISPFSIRIPSGPLNIKSFKNLSGKTPEIKGMDQLKGHMTEVLNVRDNIYNNNVKQ